MGNGHIIRLQSSPQVSSSIPQMPSAAPAQPASLEKLYADIETTTYSCVNPKGVGYISSQPCPEHKRQLASTNAPIGQLNQTVTYTCRDHGGEYSSPTPCPAKEINVVTQPSNNSPIVYDCGTYSSTQPCPTKPVASRVQKSLPQSQPQVQVQIPESMSSPSINDDIVAQQPHRRGFECRRANGEVFYQQSPCNFNNNLGNYRVKSFDDGQTVSAVRTKDLSVETTTPSLQQPAPVEDTPFMSPPSSGDAAVGLAATPTPVQLIRIQQPSPNIAIQTQPAEPLAERAPQFGPNVETQDPSLLNVDDNFENSGFESAGTEGDITLSRQQSPSQPTVTAAETNPRSPQAPKPPLSEQVGTNLPDAPATPSNPEQGTNGPMESMITDNNNQSGSGFMSGRCDGSLIAAAETCYKMPEVSEGQLNTSGVKGSLEHVAFQNNELQKSLNSFINQCRAAISTCQSACRSEDNYESWAQCDSQAGNIDKSLGLIAKLQQDRSSMEEAIDRIEQDGSLSEKSPGTPSLDRALSSQKSSPESKDQSKTNSYDRAHANPHSLYSDIDPSSSQFQQQGETGSKNKKAQKSEKEKRAQDLKKIASKLYKGYHAPGGRYQKRGRIAHWASRKKRKQRKRKDSYKQGKAGSTSSSGGSKSAAEEALKKRWEKMLKAKNKAPRLGGRGIASINKKAPKRSSSLSIFSIICKHYDSYEKQFDINEGHTQCP